MAALSDQVFMRSMCSSDLPRVMQIERSAQVMPWSRLGFEEALTRAETKSGLTDSHYINRVICAHEDSSQLCGFYIVSSVVDELHIINLAIAREYQSSGLGHYLLDDIVQQATKAQCKKIFLEVRQSNQAAIALYEKWGFHLLHIRRNYYRTPENGKEDALVMVRDFGHRAMTRSN